jgi:hypothetical protein
MSSLVIRLMVHHDLLRRLNHVDALGAAGVKQELRNAGRHTVCPGCPAQWPGKQLIVGFLRGVHDPWLQVRIAHVRNVQRRFHGNTSIVRIADHDGMRMVVCDRSDAGCRREILLRFDRDPRPVDRGEIRYGGFNFTGCNIGFLILSKALIIQVRFNPARSSLNYGQSPKNATDSSR